MSALERQSIQNESFALALEWPGLNNVMRMHALEGQVIQHESFTLGAGKAITEYRHVDACARQTDYLARVVRFGTRKVMTA